MFRMFANVLEWRARHIDQLSGSKQPGCLPLLLPRRPLPSQLKPSALDHPCGELRAPSGEQGRPLPQYAARHQPSVSSTLHESAWLGRTGRCKAPVQTVFELGSRPSLVPFDLQVEIPLAVFLTPEMPFKDVAFTWRRVSPPRYPEFLSASFFFFFLLPPLLLLSFPSSLFLFLLHPPFSFLSIGQDTRLVLLSHFSIPSLLLPTSASLRLSSFLPFLQTSESGCPYYFTSCLESPPYCL